MNAPLWNWSAFEGSAAALKWNRRDLPCLDAIIAATPGRHVAVQAGGHLGLFPKRLAEAFRTVYTFEPAADLFAMLCRNAPEPNIIKFQAAVGETPALVGLSRDRRDGKPNAHEGITHVAGEGNVPTLRIDDLALPVCDLICLDVEGYELFALKGAVETIRRCRPVLAVELNKNLGYVGLTLEQVQAFIVSLGYVGHGWQRSDQVFIPMERAS